MMVLSTQLIVGLCLVSHLSPNTMGYSPGSQTRKLLIWLRLLMRMGISTRCQTFPDFTDDPSMVRICFGLLRVMRGRFQLFTREILMKFREAPESIRAFVVFSALPANAYRVVKN